MPFRNKQHRSIIYCSISNGKFLHCMTSMPNDLLNGMTLDIQAKLIMVSMLDGMRSYVSVWIDKTPIILFLICNLCQTSF